MKKRVSQPTPDFAFPLPPVPVEQPRGQIVKRKPPKALPKEVGWRETGMLSTGQAFELRHFSDPDRANEIILKDPRGAVSEHFVFHPDGTNTQLYLKVNDALIPLVTNVSRVTAIKSEIVSLIRLNHVRSDSIIE